jgi:hypothetical protein
VARKRKSRVRIQRPPSQLVQLKVRLPEWLRRDLERAARDADRSMNSEILWRLRKSFIADEGKRDEAKMTNKLIAQTLVEKLDDDIVNEMVDIVRRIEADDAEADAWQEQERSDRAAEAAADAQSEELVDLQREGGPEEENSK